MTTPAFILERAMLSFTQTLVPLTDNDRAFMSEFATLITAMKVNDLEFSLEGKRLNITFAFGPELTQDQKFIIQTIEQRDDDSVSASLGEHELDGVLRGNIVKHLEGTPPKVEIPRVSFPAEETAKRKPMNGDQKRFYIACGMVGVTVLAVAVGIIMELRRR